MIPHSNSNVSAGLHRAKSNSSLPPRYSTSNESSTAYLERAHYQALAAASHAFEQAHERITLPVHHQDLHHRYAHSIPEGYQTPELTRQRSVRFTGPTAEPSNAKSITRRQPPSGRTDDALRRENLPLPRFEQLSEMESYVTALPRQDGSDIGMTQSSYRKLKKSKSMWSITKTSQWPFQLPNLESRRRRSLDPGLRRPLSSFRHVDTAFPDHEKYAESDAAVRLARDQFARELEQQRLRTKPSFLALKKRRQPSRYFRTSMRSGSTYASDVSPNSSQPAEGDSTNRTSIGRRARSFSTSIKSKLKRVFYGQASIDPAVPTQQLEATKAHFKDYIQNPLSESHDNGTSRLNNDNLQRIHACNESTGTEDSFLDKPVQFGSLRSIRSEGSLAHSHSRVTSWANSTQAESILPHQPIEKFRLSVIEEHGGPHQPSSSVLRHGILESAYSAFSKPPPNQFAYSGLDPFTDSHLVRSALQRRLEEHGQAESIDDSSKQQRDEAERSMRALLVPPPRKSSMTGHKNLLNSWAEGSESRESSPSQVDSQTSLSVVHKECPQLSEDDIFKPEETSIRDVDYVGISLIGSINEGSPFRHDDDSSKHHARRPLREVRSAFFPPFTHIERHSTSPYRRAMRNDNVIASAPDLAVDRKISVTLLEVPDSGSCPRCLSAADSGSIYSRSADGNTPKASHIPCSDEEPTHQNDGGTAIIVRDGFPPTKRKLPGHARGESTSSEKSSGDWKTWMATEVAALDHYPPKTERIQRRAFGHIRENADINSDDEIDVSHCGTRDSAPRYLAEALATVPLILSQNHRSLSPGLGRSPLSDLGNTRRPNETTPTRTEPTVLRGRPPSKAQNENTPPDHASSSASILRRKLSSYSLTPKDNSPALYSRVPVGMKSTPSLKGGEKSSFQETENRNDSKRDRRLKRIRSSLSSNAATKSVTHLLSLPARRESHISYKETVYLPGGETDNVPSSQSTVSLVVDRVCRSINSGTKKNGEAAFL